MADIEKLDAALKYIEEHPEEWDQADWGHRSACGTAGCLAYHVGVLDGAEILWSSSESSLEPSRAFVDAIGGKAPSAYAREALRLSTEQSYALFAGGNSLEDLKTMRDVLAKDPVASDRDLFYACRR